MLGLLVSWGVIFLLISTWAFLFSLSAPVGMAVLFAAGMAWIVCINPFIVTSVVVFSLAFGPILNLPVTADGFPFYLVLLFSAFLVWAVRALILKERDVVAGLISSHANVLVLSIYLIMVISLVNSADVNVSLKIIKRFTYCVVLYFFVLFTVKDESRLKTLISVSLVSMGLVGILGLVEAASGTVLYEVPIFNWKSIFGASISRQVLAIEPNRIAGPFGDAEAHIIHSITFFFISLSLFIAKKGHLTRILLGLLMLLLLANIFGTAYKVGIFGFGVSYILVCLFAGFRHRGRVLMYSFVVMIGILGALSVAVPQLNLERLISMRGEAGEHAQLRVRNAEMALRMFSDHPILGNGPDGFIIRYPRFAKMYPNAPRHVLTAHNQYFQMLSEHGIVGISLFLALVAVVARNLFIQMKRSTGFRRELAVGLLASISAYAILWLGSTLFLDLRFWLIIAVAGSLQQLPKQQSANE